VNGERKKRTRDSKSRKAYSAQLKAKIVQKFEPGVTQEMIAGKYGISQSLISKWLKEKESIISASTNKNKTLLKKQRKATKYTGLYRSLLTEMRLVRGKGLKVNFNWLWSKARSIQRNQTGDGDDSAVVRKHVITTFLRRHNVRMRSRQRNRSKPKEAFREDLMKWHSVTRERLIRAGAGSRSYDSKWGRFLPSQRFNLD